MANLTDKEIGDLIASAKIIEKAPHREMKVEGRYVRNDFDAVSVDGVKRFHVYLRQSLEFPEDFSVGLVYHSEVDGTPLTLFRCNGLHGEHVEIESDPSHHFHFHVHIATALNLEAGWKSDRHAEVTPAYATFQDALAYFVDRCGIIGAERYFRFLDKASQPELDFQGGADDSE